MVAQLTLFWRLSVYVKFTHVYDNCSCHQSRLTRGLVGCLIIVTWYNQSYK